MNEPVKPKRRFWQFHLSTAFLAMIVAAGFMYLNFSYYEQLYYRPLLAQVRNMSDDVPAGAYYHVRGWPLLSAKEQIPAPSTKPENLGLLHGESLLLGQVLNIPFCTLLTIVAAACFEWFLRRREGRKT